MTDRDGPRSNPYHPNPEQCCEACVFGAGEHAEWCGLGIEPTPALPSEEESGWTVTPSPLEYRAPWSALSHPTHQPPFSILSGFPCGGDTSDVKHAS
jgi:hypothetical protein